MGRLEHDISVPLYLRKGLLLELTRKIKNFPVSSFYTAAVSDIRPHSLIWLPGVWNWVLCCHKKHFYMVSPLSRLTSTFIYKSPNKETIKLTFRRLVIRQGSFQVILFNSKKKHTIDKWYLGLTQSPLTVTWSQY